MTRCSARALAPLALTAALLWMTPAAAVIVPGGGNSRSDCYAQFDVVGVANALSTRAAQCTDGDPSCDFDGACNGTCQFRVALCLNQPVEDNTRCIPPAPPGSLQTVKVAKKFANLLQVPPLDGTGCGVPLNIDVGLKKNGRKKGKTKIKVTAKSPVKPKKDKDKLKLICQPRVGECPPQLTTTTSTTVTPTTSTTTSTVPEGTACCQLPGDTVSASFVSFTTADEAGDCGDLQVFNGAPFGDVACSGLYFGGGGNSVPLPATVPDLGQAISAITSCTGQTATLGGATSIQTGSNRNCTAPGCFFGAPLAIPNTGSTPTSTCVINTVATAASGTLDCGAGTTTVNAPLDSEVFLTGDLDGGTAGIQPCPRCPAGTCIGGPNDGQPCTAGTSTLGGNTAYPTSHDCPPEPSLSLGGLPIAFVLDSGTVSWTASMATNDTETETNQARVFSGFCRDADITGNFENPAKKCWENGAAVGTACTQPNETCEQRDQGAFGPGGGGVGTITAIGSPSGPLFSGPATGKIVSVFSIPPTFDPTVDSAGDLPGPGATALPGTSELCATANPCP